MSTVTVKTADLEGVALDLAVAIATGWTLTRPQDAQIFKDGGYVLCGAENRKYSRYVFTPSTDWSQCGPLLEEFQLTLMLHQTYEISGKRFQDVWEVGAASDWFVDPDAYEPVSTDPKIAICRAIVASKLGDEVEIPVELMGKE